MSVQQRTIAQRALGYTIDQTILIVAIIAILITIIIATVGFDLINKTGGAKMASQFRQLEDANNQFFAQHNLWPSQAVGVNGNSTAAQSSLIAYALTGDRTIGFVSTIDRAAATTELRNYVSGLSSVGAGNAGQIFHSFGSNDAALDSIRMWASPVPANTGLGTGAIRYLILEMNNVPASIAREADEAIDGEADAIRGRVFYRLSNPANSSATCVAGGIADPGTDSSARVICYAANLIQ